MGPVVSQDRPRTYDDVCEVRYSSGICQITGVGVVAMTGP